MRGRSGRNNHHIINVGVAESCWGRSADWPREWPRWTAIRHAKPFLRHQTVAALVADVVVVDDAVDEAVDVVVVVVAAAVGEQDSSRIP